MTPKLFYGNLTDMKNRFKTLIIFALSLTSLACATMETNLADNGTKSLANTQWVLQKIDGDTLQTSYAITLNFSESGVSGFAGCNNYKGSYRIGDVGELKIGYLIRTKKHCPQESRSDNENLFVGRLENASKYELSNQSLNLIGEIGSIEFIAKDQAE